MNRHPLLLSAASAAIVVALLWPSEAQAQRRRVVRVAPARSIFFVGGYYSPFYDPWCPHFWYPYGFYPPYGYQGPYGPYASVRIQVTPREAEVFIGGYLAGTVDDFDGFFQRLRLDPGEHEIEIHLAGYRSVRQKLFLTPGGTFRVRHTLEPLQPGDTQDPRPTPPPAAPGSAPRDRAPYGPGPRRDEPRPSRSDERSAYGTLSIRVQPSDAEVVIDGERWEGPQADERLVVQVPAGPHRVEIRKDGYQTFSSDVQVRPGETNSLNVSLRQR